MSLPVREHVISALLGQVQVERDGYSINRSAMKECVEVYTTLINSQKWHQSLSRRSRTVISERIAEVLRC
jgi:cullin 3